MEGVGTDLVIFGASGDLASRKILPAVARLAERGLLPSRLRVIGETGVVYDLLADRWQLAGDMDVNYMIAAQKPASQKPA